jgi:hypothetical protein
MKSFLSLVFLLAGCVQVKEEFSFWMAECRYVDEMNADPDPDSAFLVQISRLKIQQSTKNM